MPLSSIGKTCVFAKILPSISFLIVNILSGRTWVQNRRLGIVCAKEKQSWKRARGWIGMNELWSRKESNKCQANNCVNIVSRGRFQLKFYNKTEASQWNETINLSIRIELNRMIHLCLCFFFICKLAIGFFSSLNHWTNFQYRSNAESMEKSTWNHSSTFSLFDDFKCIFPTAQFNIRQSKKGVCNLNDLIDLLQL